MPQIRNTKIQDIYHIIKSSKKFLIDDFKIEFPDNGNILVKILFRTSSKYSFNIEENIVSNSIFDIQLTMANKKREVVLQTIEKPGNSKNKEIHNHENIDSCIDKISSWLQSLDEDLQNEFNFEDIEAFQNIDEFEKRLNENFPDENEKFTQQEKENLTQKLQELQEKIEKLEQNNDTKKQIEIIEQSKIEIEKYPKKAWWLKFYNRFNSLNNGLNLLNNISDNIIKLLDKFGA
jgi:hypothetical protein